MRTHDKAQMQKFQDMRKIAQNDLKARVSDRLRCVIYELARGSSVTQHTFRRNIVEHVRSEIVNQVRQQVDVQIQDYIRVPLSQQALDNKLLLEEMQISLRNS